MEHKHKHKHNNSTLPRRNSIINREGKLTITTLSLLDKREGWMQPTMDNNTVRHTTLHPSTLNIPNFNFDCLFLLFLYNVKYDGMKIDV
jgi:hypothetical protein